MNNLYLHANFGGEIVPVTDSVDIGIGSQEFIIG